MGSLRSLSHLNSLRRNQMSKSRSYANLSGESFNVVNVRAFVPLISERTVFMRNGLSKMPFGEVAYDFYSRWLWQRRATIVNG